MYANCPHCGSSNRVGDDPCYNCNKPLQSGPVHQPAAQGEAFYANPNNRIVVTNGPSALPEYSAQGLTRLPWVVGFFFLTFCLISYDVLGPVLLLFGVPLALIIGLCVYFLKATAETEVVLRSGRVISGRILSGEIKAGGRGGSRQLVVRYAFEGDNGPVQSQSSCALQNFSDMWAKPPAPETPCYILYKNDKVHRLL